MHYTGASDESVTAKLADALAVIVLDPRSRAWLQTHDPKAFKQACDALHAAKRRTTPEAMVTKQQAEAVLAAVREQFKDYRGVGASAPTLREGGDDFWGSAAPWVVSWEDGPDEWALRFPDGGVDEELTAEVQAFAPGQVIRNPAVSLPPGVAVEPIVSFEVGIYPA